jgi:FkbM family methyltransferase
MMRLLRHHWHKTVPRHLGKWAKYRGFVNIAGCRFHVDVPEISPGMAGVMMQGNYEGAEVDAIRAYLDPSLPVIECGAAMGITSCIANRKLHRPTDHIAIEPNPLALRMLKRNKTLNQSQFTIVEAAIGYDTGTVTFTPGDEILAAHVGDSAHAIAVRATTLRDHARWQRFSLLCDIEGTELELFERDGDLIRERVPLLILETHDTARGHTAQVLFPWLQDAGFRQAWRHESVSVWTRPSPDERG